MAYLPNVGQWDHPADFVASFGTTTAYLDANGVRLAFAEPRTGPDSLAESVRERLHSPGALRRAVAVDLLFVEGAHPTPEPEAALAGRHSFFLDAPDRWRTDVPGYGAVRYRKIYDGVDLLCHSLDGHFEYDLEIAAGTDLTAIALEFAGVDELRIDDQGAVIFDTAIGAVRQTPPVAYTIDVHGKRTPIAAHHRLLGGNRFTFAVPDWDRRQALVIDPGILYSGVFGSFAGAMGAIPGGMARSNSGRVTIVGTTDRLAYPTTPGAYRSTPIRNGDLFVTQIDPSLPTAQQHRYSTYLGGSAVEDLASVAIDSAGVITVAAYTDSVNFPTTAGAFTTPTPTGGADCIVSRLDPSLTGTAQLVYSSRFGGGGFDIPLAVAIGLNGDIAIAGFVDSTNFPVTPSAFDASLGIALGKCFVAVLSPALPTAQQLRYATYLGGSNSDEASSVALDVFGRVVVAGRAESTNFPTTPGALQTIHGSPIMSDGFVAIFDPAQSNSQQLVYSTLFGGNADDWVDQISIDATADVVTMVGTTGSDNLAVTPNAYQSASPLPTQQYFGTFVARLHPSAPTAQQLVYSTYLTGSTMEFPYDMAQDLTGAVVVTGFTYSTDYPTTPGAYAQTFTSTNLMGFVSRLDPALPPTQQLVYSTLLGDDSGPVALALDPQDQSIVTVVGAAGPTHPTTPGAFGTPAGANGAFLTRLDLRPTGVSAFGASSATCDGPLVIGTLSWPQVGNAAFARTCANAPSNSFGAALLSPAALSTPILVFGCDLWIVPSGLLLDLVVADATGHAVMPTPVPALPSLAGLQACAQFAFFDPSRPISCSPQGWSASNALTLTVQP